MNSSPRFWRMAPAWMVLATLVTAAVYWPGLSGGWLFDDYPSIVLNPSVQPAHPGLASLIDAALSSTSGPFKRPLASLSFALNFSATGLDPYWMKLTNLFFHLLNGWLVFLLARALLQSATGGSTAGHSESRTNTTAVLVAAAWMLLPINLTGVLYVVQRMESMANLFVLLGLLGYVKGRRRMLATQAKAGAHTSDRRGLALCIASVTIPTILGLLAKETAVMLPLYALLIEWMLFRAHRLEPTTTVAVGHEGPGSGTRPDRRIWTLFTLVLAVPMLIGMAWLIPHMLGPSGWATRDFTMRTRLLSEARIVLDYIRWTLLPTSRALSFYHDDFAVSAGWLAPWTTLASALGLTALAALSLWLRRRMPLAALGLALFFGAHLLTGTILPLDLIYEHRNYFASFGLLLALVPLLTAPEGQASPQHSAQGPSPGVQTQAAAWRGTLPYARLRHGLLAVLLLSWTMQTALGAYIWGSPSRLTLTLAERAPQSPRAQYALGLNYSIYSQYNPSSPFVPLAYEALERAARLPKSSVLPEQALIFLNARMHMPARSAWWDSLLAKLRAHAPTPEDQNALRTLSICAIDHRCDLPTDRMNDAFRAILSHPKPGAQMYARYGDYAWNVLRDKALGERMMAKAVQADPREPDYRVALIHMLVALGQKEEARKTLHELEPLNIGGYLDKTLRELQALPGLSGSSGSSNPDAIDRT